MHIKFHGGNKDTGGMICSKHNQFGIETIMSGMNGSLSSLLWEYHNPSSSAPLSNFYSS